VRALRWPANLFRGLFLLGFLLVVLAVYALGQLALWLAIRDREVRARRTARWRGKVLRHALTLLGATFIKMGQVLSSRPDLLPPEIIAELEILQDRLPAFGFGRVRRVMTQELGQPPEAIFAELDPVPVAAASVAQVHRGRLPDGREVAVKVLRPNVRRQVERDAAILMLGARLLALSPTLRLSDPVGHLRHFVEAIIEQTDLTREAIHYERFAANFAGSTDVRFPGIHRDLCARRVLTMDFMRGTRYDGRDRAHDRALAATIRRTVLKMAFADGFVHADLHPGNFLIQDGTRLVLFDAGMAKLLGPDVLEQFVDFSRCLALGTTDDFVDHIRRYHTYVGEIDWDGVRRDIGALLGTMRAKSTGQLEYGVLFADIFAIARRYRVRPIPDLTLVMVALMTVQGIGKVLDPESNVFVELGGFLLPLLAARSAASAGPPPG
jgi:ubiquinone biosynthesis protein